MGLNKPQWGTQPTPGHNMAKWHPVSLADEIKFQITSISVMRLFHYLDPFPTVPFRVLGGRGILRLPWLERR